MNINSDSQNDISWFYIREQLYSGGIHRRGCIALEKLSDSDSKIQVAFSLCRGKDQFVTSVARTKAISKLQSSHSITIDVQQSSILNNSSLVAFQYLRDSYANLDEALERNLSVHQSTYSAFAGALKELFWPKNKTNSG